MKLATALVAAVGSASAADLTINTFQSFPTTNLVQSLIQSVSFIGLEATGAVTYKQCADDAGVFTLDTASTTNTPKIVTKGKDVNFHLAGILDDSVSIDNVHVHVNWNSTPLYDEDHKGAKSFDDEVTYDLAWNVPGFAPSGHYDVTITGLSGSKKQFCVNAQMDL